MGALFLNEVIALLVDDVKNSNISLPVKRYTG